MNALEIVSRWNALTAAEQYQFCGNCVKRSIKSGRTLKAGYDMEDATQETYVKVLQRLTDVDKLEADCRRRQSQGKPNTLEAVICRAANATMESVLYADRKHGRASSRTITDENGNELDMLESVASSADTEKTAILKIQLRQYIASLDDIDRLIFQGMIDGKTERAIAPQVRYSCVTVHKRMKKIREELAEILK